jgi:hypothetical protein
MTELLRRADDASELAPGKRQFDLDRLGFASRQVEDVACLANSPACNLEFPAFLNFHPSVVHLRER